MKKIEREQSMKKTERHVHSSTHLHIYRYLIPGMRLRGLSVLCCAVLSL